MAHRGSCFEHSRSLVWRAGQVGDPGQGYKLNSTLLHKYTTVFARRVERHFHSNVNRRRENGMVRPFWFALPRTNAG